jgi:MFS family permease
VPDFAAGFGRIAAGFIADRIGAVNCLFMSFFIGGLSQMVMWPFVKTFGSITGFAIISGFFGSWFMSLLAVACSRLFGGHGLATMTGFMILANSPGQLLGSTVATSVLQASGQRWWAVCITSGGLMLLGAVTILPARFKGQRKLFGKI